MSVALSALIVSLGAVQAAEVKSLTLGSVTKAKQCSASKCDAAKCESCQGCPIAKAMEQLPKISFAVGSEQTCCSKSAEAIAKKLNKPIRFVVAKKTFDTQNDAHLALVEETEAFVKAFAEPKVCQVSGTTTVAGKKVCCESSASETAKLVKTAMDKVAMTYLVGEKKCDCPVEAEKVAKAKGKAAVFLVGGEKTSCKVTARLNLARAKYRAAVEALVKSESKQAETEQKS